MRDGSDDGRAVDRVPAAQSWFLALQLPEAARVVGLVAFGVAGLAAIAAAFLLSEQHDRTEAALPASLTGQSRPGEHVDPRDFEPTVVILPCRRPTAPN